MQMQPMQGFQKLVEAVGGMAIALAIVAAIALVGLLVAVLICLFLSSCLTRLPEEHRRVNPGLVWLLLIPCFPVVWNFFVYPKVAESFQSYFDAQGRTDVGDCSRGLATLYCILTVVSTVLGIIPFIGAVNCLLGPAILVIWTLLLVRFAGYKGQVQG
jgi:hypothetical protein